METSSLPSFALMFLNNLKLQNKSQVTIKDYTGELTDFFTFLCEHREDPEIFAELRDKNKAFCPLPSLPQDITLEELKKVTHWHIQSYLAYVKDERNLAPRTLSRKQAALKSLYRYLFRKDLIEVDVSQKLDPISIPDEDIIAMEPNEVAALIDLVENGTGFTEHQRLYMRYTQKRDLAIILSFIGSGLRLMELQQLDVSDINFDKNEFHILGKRNKITTQPFNMDVAGVLLEYLKEERQRLVDKRKDSEPEALFLSLQGKRLSRNAIQKLVEKYMKLLSNEGITTDHYTVHKLRSTCATLLLRETGNLPLVQDYLRHKDPKTTRKYAKVIDEELRRASGLIKFR